MQFYILEKINSDACALVLSTVLLATLAGSSPLLNSPFIVFLFTYPLHCFA